MGPGPVRTWFRRLVEPTGCVVVDDAADADGVVWLDPHDPAGLAAVLAANERIRWVQLPAAGVERIVAAGLIRPDGEAGTSTSTGPRIWTAAKGIYGEPVAEHALALLLAGLRHLDERTRAATWGDRRG